MMMVMFLAVKFELPVLYSVDLLHAAEGFNSVLGWTVSYWIQVENRDLWECILYLRRQLRAMRPRVPCPPCQKQGAPPPMPDLVE